MVLPSILVVVEEFWPTLRRIQNQMLRSYNLLLNLLLNQLSWQRSMDSRDQTLLRLRSVQKLLMGNHKNLLSYERELRKCCEVSSLEDFAS